ncbi:MAG: hypothetical protein ACI9E5_001225 [Candidatus Omnitrophota bacterium]|jgi:hypothetical protein
MCAWHKQKIADNCQDIECSSYDHIKDFEMEVTGCYVLIRTNSEDKLIEVAICIPEHVVTHTFSGKTCQELYHTIFTYEKEHNLNWFTNKEHMAYLGKELKKCEIALSSGVDYYQE